MQLTISKSDWECSGQIANLEEMLVLGAERPGSNHGHCQTLRLAAGSHCLVGAGQWNPPSPFAQVLSALLSVLGRLPRLVSSRLSRP